MTRDGSDQVTLQVYHGTRYIDEVVGLRVADMGRVYVHQDANWNVTALTDLMGRTIERYWYSPYGELEAQVVLHPFDVDWDGDVDSDDYDATTACSGPVTGDCRVLDADADGDVDAADQTIIAAYIATLDADTELQRIPASPHSRRGNPFGHQGLVLDAELASYQNRARQYAPKAKRFMQRDPMNLRRLMVGRFRHNSFLYVNGTPIATTDWSGLSPDACAELEAAGEDGGSRGGVACVNGVKEICVWTNNFPEWWGPVQAEIADCVHRHEETHLDDIDCPECGISRSPVRDREHFFEEECEGYMESAQCAVEKLTECYTTNGLNSVECHAIQDYLDRSLNSINFFCL